MHFFAGFTPFAFDRDDVVSFASIRDSFHLALKLTPQHSCSRERAFSQKNILHFVFDAHRAFIWNDTHTEKSCS